MPRLKGLVIVAWGIVFLCVAYQCFADTGAPYTFIKGFVALASAIVLLFCGAKVATDLAHDRA